MLRKLCVKFLDLRARGAAKVAGSGEAAGPLDDEYTGASLMGESLRIRFGGQRHPILINERNKY